MGILGDLFGKKPRAPQPPERAAANSNPEAQPPSGPADAIETRTDSASQSAPDVITFYDAYGRKVQVPKAHWRAQMLPAEVASHWTNPTPLYQTIVDALNEQVFPEVLGAAEQLFRIDPDHARGSYTYAMVLLKNDRLDDAERVLRNYLEQYGDDGIILTSLAKVYSERQDDSKAEETLWHAIEIDPNLDNGLLWYASIQRERDGESGYLTALSRAAAFPTSWRAQIWLARASLQQGNIDDALRFYEEFLTRAPKPVPTDALMQMSGDLGTSGRLDKVVEVTEPYFDVTFHGLRVGNNLIKANLDLGRLDEASRVLNQLYSLNRPDYRDALAFWETEIARARVKRNNPPTDAKFEMQLLRIDGPLWFAPSRRARPLFDAEPQHGPVVGFLGSTAEVPNAPHQAETQLADRPGRMSRILPIFLSEHIHFATNASAQAIIPCLAVASGGFILSGRAWGDETAANYATFGEQTGAPKCDYVVTTHLLAQSSPWRVKLRVIRTSNHQVLDTLTAAFQETDPFDAFSRLTQDLVTSLADSSAVMLQSMPADYVLPARPSFSNYLLRLEQLLAVLCDGRREGPSNLNNVREILSGNIQLCLECPQNTVTRLVLAQTTAGLAKVHPEVVAEFRDKLVLLQSSEPLPEPGRGVVQAILDEALGV